MSENVLKKRKEELLKGFKKQNIILYIILAFIVWFGYYVRTRNLWLLKDITTGKYIPLASDPHVFLRYAKYIVEHGTLFKIDYMRYFPLGFNMKGLHPLPHYFIAYLYKFLHFFDHSITIEKTHVLYPPICFVVGAIFFFLLLKRLFNYKVALISTAFLTVIPPFLYRTIAGFSDKEALATIFIFMTFYFLVRGWQERNVKKTILFGILAGITTGLAALSWGGVNFVYMIIGMFGILCIMLNRFSKKDFYLYTSWFLVLMLALPFIDGFALTSFTRFFTSTTTGIVAFAFFMGLVNFFIFKLDILKLKEKIKTKLPSGFATFLISIILILFLVTIFIDPFFVVNKATQVTDELLNPLPNRWLLTVQESKEPYITDWITQMSLTYILLIILGSAILVYETLKDIKTSFNYHKITENRNDINLNNINLNLHSTDLLSNVASDNVNSDLSNKTFVENPSHWYVNILRRKYSLSLVAGYALLLLLFIFSRYSKESPIFNGDTTIAQLAFIGSGIGLVLGIVIFYLYMFYKDKKVFNQLLKIRKEYIFVLIWFIITLMAARRAVRLIFIFAPVTTVLFGYFSIKLFDYAHEFLKKDWYKMIAYILIGILVVSTFSSFAKTTLTRAKYTGPVYNQQWQKAGAWIRDNTTEDSVFAHWWDYGYLVQTGGERATILDGGNSKGYWNYMMGRYVLTGQSDEEPLPFLYAHNATHLLIISDEIGKYPAFSSIGSDANYDRYSWINTFILDEKNVQDLTGKTVYLYRGGTSLDEDLIYEDKLYPKQAAGIAGFFINMQQKGNKTVFDQPFAILVYNGQQAQVPLNCIFFNGKEITFESEGLDGCLSIIPKIDGQKMMPVGAALYLSPKVRKSRIAQLYLFGKESDYFKLFYTDEQEMPLSLYNGRTIGPLKIWEISYPSDVGIPEGYFCYSEKEKCVHKIYCSKESECPEGFFCVERDYECIKVESLHCSTIGCPKDFECDSHMGVCRKKMT